jgi:hypothetical protein
VSSNAQKQDRTDHMSLLSVLLLPLPILTCMQPIRQREKIFPHAAGDKSLPNFARRRSITLIGAREQHASGAGPPPT